MSAYYFDSSALVKYYAQEVGTKWVRGLIDARPSNEIFTALLTGVETVPAIKRRERMNLITASDAGAALAVFRNQFRSRFKAFRTSDAVVDRAMNARRRTNCVATMRFNWRVRC